MKKLLFSLLLLPLILLFTTDVYAGRGCCSYHGGQSYCDTSVGRWVCNDGTYSPSCGCYQEPVNIAPLSKERFKQVIEEDNKAFIEWEKSLTPTPTPTPTLLVKSAVFVYNYWILLVILGLVVVWYFYEVKKEKTSN